MLRTTIGLSAWACFLTLHLQRFIWGEVLIGGISGVLLGLMFFLIVFFLVVADMHINIRKYPTVKELMK
jgi:hypothetical protein